MNSTPNLDVSGKIWRLPLKCELHGEMAAQEKTNGDTCSFIVIAIHDMVV